MEEVHCVIGSHKDAIVPEGDCDLHLLSHKYDFTILISSDGDIRKDVQSKMSTIAHA